MINSNSSNLLFLTQFADDSTATFSSKNLNQALANAEQEFLKILDWLAHNKLKLT